jgi:hypothetical protein
MDITDEVKAVVIIGDDAEEFLSTELGKVLLGMVKQEVDVAALEMKDVDLKDDKKLRDIQNRIWRATQFEAWLRELIHNGREALQAYQQQ